MRTEKFIRKLEKWAKKNRIKVAINKDSNPENCIAYFNLK